jgi:hypothetical protein
MRLLFAKIYRLPFQLPYIGNFLSYVIYVLAITIPPLVVWLSGGRRLKYGNSIIFTPRERELAIQDGVELLRKCDPNMFNHFTKQMLNIAYSHNMRSPNNGGRFYSLHERYVKLGPECIAVFIVQCTLLAEVSSSLNRFRLKPSELVALKAAPRKVLEWADQHAFNPELINSYRKVVEKWEAGKRFQTIE